MDESLVAPDSPELPKAFQTTQWQLVRSAGDPDDESLHHLNQLLKIYRPALVQFAEQHLRKNPANAEDLVHGFISAKILHGSLVQRADPTRGRFRTLLLGALTNYARTENRKSSAQKRHPSEGLVPWHEVSEDSLPSNEIPPDEREHFDTNWNREIINEALRRFQWHCDRRRKLAMWEIFDGRILAPILREHATESYESLQERLGLESHAKATNLLMAAKRSFTRILIQVIQEFALNTDDAEQELQELKIYCRL